MASLASQDASTLELNEEEDIRVNDYLNDKLQNNADLEGIDSLLEDVRDRQNLLGQQLKDAEATLEQAKKALEEHSSNVLRQAEKFSKQQKDIDRRLLIVTQSETSDDAVRKFDAHMEKLQRLDIAKGYMELLREVDRLSAEARHNFRQAPQAALQPYTRLQDICAALKEAQPAAEGAAPHLIDHVERTTIQLWKQMKDAFGSEFEETLVKMKWPSKDAIVAGRLGQEWVDGVEKLLDLQEPELNARENKDARQVEMEEPLVLLPLEVMVKPLELRFRYHFDGDRATNRPDKPEYFISHAMELLNTYNTFFCNHLQPILRSHFKGTNLALNPIYIDSTSAFITSLLPMLRHKVFRLLPQLSTQPQLLSHFIHELMSFDSTIRDDWGYGGTFGTNGWKGLTWEVLVKRDWFGKWLSIEKNFALSRYQTIVETSESREIDYDSVDPGTTKPTKAAIRVNDLLETVTDRYRPLTSFSQKLRFLIDIQIAIFDRFHTRLHDSLEAYLTLTSSIARTVQGVSRDEQNQLQGLSGLERLCRVYGSAEYLEKKMRDWSDDVFFLELWDELQDRARRSSGDQKLAGPMSMNVVAGHTSSAVGAGEDSGGALFDETAGAYKRLRIRSEGIIQDMLIHNVRETLRSYGRTNSWASVSSSETANLTLTAELDATVQQLSSYLFFLSKVLAQVSFRRIARQVALSIQTYLWDHVLIRNSFSATGSAQFARDLESLWEVMDRYLGAGQGQLGMRRLAEAVIILNLDESGPEESGEQGQAGGERVTLAGLREVEQRVFESNESAREVLAELGLELLTESEARTVLQRRIELGN